MGTSLPPGVIRGNFTFSPGPHITPEEAARVIREIIDTQLTAPGTEAEIEVHYEPTR